MKFIKYSLLVLLGLLIVLLVWGVAFEPYRVDQQEETATVPGLPADWKGQQVALIADFQVGMWLSNTATVEDIAKRLVQQQPALVLIAGDFIYHPTDEDDHEDVREELESEDIKEVFGELERTIELFQPLLQAGIPVYAVLGNHDYAMATPKDVKLGRLADQVHETLETAGIQVLENEAMPLPSPVDEGAGEDEKLYLVGIGSHYANNADPQRALAQLPDDAPRLVLMHNPASFEALPAGSAPLALAAHTHGGQIRLPFMPAWSWMALLADDPVHGDGWVEGVGQAGNRLYVNRGIGFSVVPVRINATPEVTLFTLE